jgi:hypothetical protein
MENGGVLASKMSLGLLGLGEEGPDPQDLELEETGGPRGRSWEFSLPYFRAYFTVSLLVLALCPGW